MPCLPWGQTGAVTTGHPANEMGCVSRPMAARQGKRWPCRSNHSVPIGWAATGVAGASSTSQCWNKSLTLSRYTRRKRWARTYQAAGCNAPARKRSTDNGSKSSALCRSASRCKAPPSLAVTITLPLSSRPSDANASASACAEARAPRCPGTRHRGRVRATPVRQYRPSWRRCWHR